MHLSTHFIHRPSSKTAPSQGFSLIELLIVLGCVAVLTSLALPTYQGWQERSQRSQARLALMQAAQWLERSATANGRYPKLEEVPANVWSTQGLRYQIQAQLSDQSFTLSAQPMGSQASDACGTLTLTHLGEQGVQQAALSAAACWQR